MNEDETAALNIQVDLVMKLSPAKPYKSPKTITEFEPYRSVWQSYPRFAVTSRCLLDKLFSIDGR